ncbi:hypothetical protein IU500_02495 [Nocardia terpenica]|uniref:hypothetical protein n=1 Tax=Nocardia terpenica TaxID=455432 RepID=UPI0018943FDA|nr:hypothetical protein [Nocardia terpenica]MBF6059554.1 hypothetical protein [Nocardia terpenica]MBF6102907.1 hypothetical protein [Nocardia terpenica]MBF6110904.1 hypothetical protein [Nocardia terpenica]MBF6117035.1 hypothetical protein [Nocardia terpenica]MBF6151127.1 hypothetical protein [Nocardia terpenica]
MEATEIACPTGQSDILLASADESVALLPWVEICNVGPLMISDLRDSLRWVTGEYLKSPTLPLFRRVVETRDRTVELLRGRQTPKQSVELHSIAGWSMTVLAWMTTDLGRPDIARRHLRPAWAFADNADDNDLRAWIRAAENTAAAWQGDYDQAAEAAASGLEYRASGSVELLLASARAIDLAHLGRTDESASALHEALDIAARQADEASSDPLAGPFSCSLERAGGYWADAAMVNGDAARSIDFTSEAIERFRRAVPAERNLGSERMVRCQQIKGHVVLGDLDVAVAELTKVVAMTPLEHRVEPLRQRVEEIVRLAQQTYGNSPQVVEISHMAREFQHFADLGNLPALAADTNGE